MLGDAPEVERDSTLACDVCIVGGGPAGITMALELARAQLDVLLLESGGLEPAAATQNLNEGELRGAPQFPTAMSRLRQLGGTSGHWAGMCRPLDASDFEKREWVPHSGWPITRRDLDPYYGRAQVICELGPYDYSRERWPELLTPEAGLERLDCNMQLIQLSAPTRFGQRYRPDLESAKSLRVLLHSTVTQIVPAAGGRAIEHVEVQSLGGQRFRVRARTYVVACGGIENARLLLLSNRVLPKGVGNERDWVGRCFMDHPAAQPVGLLQLLRPEANRLVQAQPPPKGMRRRVMVGLGFGPETRRAQRLLDTALYVARPQPVSNAPAEERTVRFLQSVAGTAGPIDLRSGWLRSEQAPNPESRVTLADQLDSFGQRRVRLEWKLTELDHQSFTRSARMFARALGAAGLARIELEPWLLENQADWWTNLKPGWHHMGTTRMADGPANGVVDADCKIFGIDNLFVAGSSVFATSGYVNPTLTIVALALRLAERVKQRR
jgi:choline dehydrogenase-like flavoprotein